TFPGPESYGVSLGHGGSVSPVMPENLVLVLVRRFAMRGKSLVDAVPRQRRGLAFSLMIRVFVSGCYDILHAGHVQFFREARALGDHLTVCFASNDVLWLHKQRRSSLPDEHKRALLAALDGVDEVVIGTGTEEGIDFREHCLRLRPDVLAVTEADKYGQQK